MDDNTVTLSNYSNKKNGAVPVYTGNKVRQDIYVAEEDAIPASIKLTGDLVNKNRQYIGDGTIWVWAEHANHHKQLMPFAVLGDGVDYAVVEEGQTELPTGKLDAAHLKAFRNAQDDDTTENGTDTYLFGTIEGDVACLVYWSGSAGARKVILKKVVQSNEVEGSNKTFSTYDKPQGEKEFTIYKGNSTTAYTPKGAANALSGKLSNNSTGIIWIGELPYGWYIIEEEDPERYFYVVVDQSGVYENTNAGGYDTREGTDGADAAAKAKYDALQAARKHSNNSANG
jgi:hypothetical protein